MPHGTPPGGECDATPSPYSAEAERPNTAPTYPTSQPGSQRTRDTGPSSCTSRETRQDSVLRTS